MHSVSSTPRPARACTHSLLWPRNPLTKKILHGRLFTVGTEHLNPDGTFVLDEDGNRVRTYGVKDVASFARTWTGFVPTSGRRPRSNTIAN
eukprot:COSAG02_NODE_46172_length_351_cov_0.757937_1_plen_90_part_10